MAEFKTARLNQEIRLRNWPSGRVNVLRLAVQQLEESLNSSLASTVVQTERRKISDQIPFILDLAVNPGFRQATATWSAPPGLGTHPLRQLLFYELQYDGDPTFASPTTVTTSQPNFAIAGVSLGSSLSVRIRVVNTFGDASIWSSVVSVTIAQSRIQQTLLDDITMRLETPVGVWKTILENDFNPVDAKLCINAQIALAGLHFDTDRMAGAVVRKTLYGGPSYAQFRWRIGSFNDATETFDLAETGQRTILSNRPGYTVASDKSSVRNPLAFGTFMTEFITITPGIEARVQLQACKLVGTEWLGETRSRSLQTSDPVVAVRSGKVIEVLQDI